MGPNQDHRTNRARRTFLPYRGIGVAPIEPVRGPRAFSRERWIRLNSEEPVEDRSGARGSRNRPTKRPADESI